MRCRNKRKNKKQKDEEEEERYNKTKFSKLGRSVFEPTIHELTISLWENAQNHKKCEYSHRNITRQK